MRKRATSNNNLFVVLSQISQEFAFILMQIYQHKCLLLSKAMSDFKSNYTTSMCRFQKCKKINFEKLLLVAHFLIRGHNYILYIQRYVGWTEKCKKITSSWIFLRTWNYIFCSNCFCGSNFFQCRSLQ